MNIDTYKIRILEKLIKVKDQSVLKKIDRLIKQAELKGELCEMINNLEDVRVLKTIRVILKKTKHQ